MRNAPVCELKVARLAGLSLALSFERARPPIMVANSLQSHTELIEDYAGLTDILQFVTQRFDWIPIPCDDIESHLRKSEGKALSALDVRWVLLRKHAEADM